MKLLWFYPIELFLHLGMAGAVAAPGDVPEGEKIAAGYRHSLTLKSDGTVVAWGRNFEGQLNVPGSAELSGLTIDAGVLSPSFDPSVTDYTYQYVGASVTSVNVTASLSDPAHAALLINNETATSGSAAEVALTGASTVISVQAEPYLLSGKTYSITVLKDSTPPSIDMTMTTEDGNPYADPEFDTWTNQNVTVSAAASDGNSVTSFVYSLDGGATWSDYTSDIGLNVDGVHMLSFKAVDVAGNALSAPLAVRIDKTAPSVSFGTNGNENKSRSASTTVTVTDGGSGADPATLQYAWTTDTSTPVTGWTAFTSGNTDEKRRG